MAANESDSAETSAGPFGGRVALVLNGLAVGAIGWTLQQFTDSFAPQPWQALWIMIPLGAVAVAIYHLRKKKSLSSLQLTGSMQVFLTCYLLFFCLAASRDVLVFKRESVLIEKGNQPRYWFVPAWLGDWRYRIPPQHNDVSVNLVIVKIPGAKTNDDQNERMLRRKDFARLINLAVDAQAQGVALDYYFERDKNNPSAAGQFDSLLAEAVKKAAEKKIPILSGVSFSLTDKIATPYPPSLDQPLGPDNRVHLQGYVDGDGYARFVAGTLQNPVFNKYQSLSVRVAIELARINSLKFDVPKSELLQFWDLPGNTADQILTFDELWAMDPAARKQRLYGNFILVGEDSPSETFATPFGDRLGVVLHAATIHSLLNGSIVQRTPWWSGLLIILLACYAITAMASAGASKLRLLKVAAGISIFLFAAAAMAMWLWHTWLDVVYAQTAVWLLLVLLLTLRRPQLPAQPPPVKYRLVDKSKPEI